MTHSPDNYAGKAVMITGASRGIGAAAARAYAAAGASVLLAARSEAAIEALAEELRAAGANARSVRCDVSVYADVQAAVELCRQAFGRIDILINNAGVVEPIARIEESDPAAWGAAFDVNAKGVYYGLRAAAPAMVAQGSGVIVNISSGAAYGALEGWSHYCSGKAAALSLTRCGARELGEKGVRVVGLSPGTVATDMQTAIKTSGVNPVSQLNWEDHIPAEWVAQAILWLSSPAGAAHDGADFSLKTEEGRRAAGLPAPGRTR
ncbi:MAG: SDR family oxidoreductase [Neomegalonema sp.]|nr:SDR family oxidoreductase [Neomegalonema sp.]